MNNAPSFWKNIQRREHFRFWGGDFFVILFWNRNRTAQWVFRFWRRYSGSCAAGEKRTFSSSGSCNQHCADPASVHHQLGVYYLRGNLSLGQSLFFFVPALLGSVCGAWCLKRIPVFLLKISFSILILYSAAKILLT